MPIPNRTILLISGKDRVSFLTGLVTNDPKPGALVYSALLTPQGKYLADFFLLMRGEDILLDIHSDLAGAIAARLSMYKLRADVEIAETDMPVSRGRSIPAPDGALADPRHEELGWRLYGAALPEEDVDWDGLRVAHIIPETGIELVPNESYILEMGLERLNGVDHRKGCYVGQEVTARMKHKTELRKGLALVKIDHATPAGTEITADGKPVGTVLTQSGNHAIAYLRFDRAKPEMQAGAAHLTYQTS